MTYPGLGYQKGPPPQTAVGQQVRQSRAGEYPGFYSVLGGRWVNAFHGMGTHAPAAGVTAETLTVEQEMTAFPFAIEQDDFEKGSALGGTEQGGYDVIVSHSPNFFTMTFPFTFGTYRLADFPVTFPLTFVPTYLVV